MKDSLIRQVWATEQEILDTVHEICLRNHIRYSIFYGTLLGAVRHKGFIPWDDDIDIAMPRRDFERFRKVWIDFQPEGYVLQDYHTDTDYMNNHMKIRKDHTTFLQFDIERERNYHKGIFVDVFPMDRVAPGPIRRKIQYIAGAVNLLYSKGYSSGSDGMIGTVERLLLKVPNNIKLLLRDGSEIVLKHWSYKAVSTPFFSGCTFDSLKKYYPENMFQRLRYIEFNHEKYLSVKDTDAILRVEYGNYMQLPPEEERVWKHHPLEIDFTHNYEELYNY